MDKEIMDNNNISRKKYAVVKFVVDSTYSEIPTAWLINDNNDNNQCWWPPRTANCATLIANCATPNQDTWHRYEVTVIRYSSSIESARKNAADANYHTTDEERLGRGKRQHVAYNRYSSSDNEETRDNRQSRKIKSNNKRLTISTSSAPLALPLCPDDLGLICPNERLNVMQTNDEDNNNMATLMHGRRNDSFLLTSQYVNIQDVPVVVGKCTPLMKINVQEDFDIKESLKRMQASTNITLQDIKQRLIKVEGAIKTHKIKFSTNENNLIVHLLSCASLDSIKDFEILLRSTDVAVMQFKEYILKVGGNNPRNNIQRSLVRIITNDCAMSCSWKGIRNNFRVSNLYLIKIMKEEIMSYHPTLTETEFENIVAEWLRFAKQRKERNEKTKGYAYEENANGSDNDKSET